MVESVFGAAVGDSMNVCFSLRSEAVGAMRAALVSAENLQLTLKTELSQEEQALTHSDSSPKEAHKAGYCSKIAVNCVFHQSDISLRLGYCFLIVFFSLIPKFAVF